MTTRPERPEPIPDVYRLCDLPVGTKYRWHIDTERVNAAPYAADAHPHSLVQVVEWPQRTYDGLPAADVDRVLDRVELLVAEGSPVVGSIARIREAIARQADT